MKRLEFPEATKLADILKALEREPESEIEIHILPPNRLLKIKLNKEVIKLAAQGFGKKISFKEEPTQRAEFTPSADNLGFVEGKDIAKESQTIPPAEPAPVKKFKFGFSKLAILKKQKWLYIFAGLFALIIGTLLSLFWFLPSATVTLFTQAQFKEAEITLIASPTAEKVDSEKKIIPLKILNTDEEDLLETKATGIKTIGTAAKGPVRIINHHPTKDWTFYKGLILTPKICPNMTCPKINFSLDETATVSAAPLPNYGETKATVTAMTIGEEGNLPHGTAFQIGSADMTTVFATNDVDFQGGTSKKVTVISADDQKKAKEDLLKRLEEKARRTLKNENPDISIPKGSLETEILEEVYTKKVDEEAENFSLSLKVKFTATVFSESDLKGVLINSISDSLPAGYEIDSEGSVVESEILEKSAEDLKILGKIKAALSPKINYQEVRKNIAGKNFSTTEYYLKSLSNIEGFEIKINPGFFRIFSRMPFLETKIKIQMIKEG